MQVFVNIVISASLFFLIALSFNFIYLTSKFFHIAHAIIITFGAYFTYLFYNQITIPLFFSILISIVLSTFVGHSFGLFINGFLRKKGNSLVLFIGSLGLYIIFQNVISLIWGDGAKIIQMGKVDIGNQLFSAYITNNQIIIICISVIGLILNLFLFNYTKRGIQMKAVSSNEELANIYGIKSDKIILLAFLLGSIFASTVGIMVALNVGMSPTMGFNLLLYGVVAMIIGGVGSTWGLIGGSLLLATAQHLGAYYIDSKWIDAIAYIILILFLIWKPLGFSGKRLKKIEI